MPQERFEVTLGRSGTDSTVIVKVSQPSETAYSFWSITSTGDPEEIKFKTRKAFDKANTFAEALNEHIDRLNQQEEARKGTSADDQPTGA